MPGEASGTRPLHMECWIAWPARMRMTAPARQIARRYRVMLEISSTAPEGVEAKWDENDR